MIFNLLIGLLLIVIGAEAFLRGAGTLRKHFALPSFVVGLILIGFGTSLPELAVGIGATLARFEGVALGLLLGSVIVNMALILGLCALIEPIRMSSKAIGRDGAATVIAALYLLLGTLMEPTGLVWPLIGLALFALYVALTFFEERRLSGTGVMARKAEFVRTGPAKMALGLGLVVLGLGGIIYGSAKLIEGSVGYAADLGLPLTVIGLALLAVITSIPEAVVSIHSTIKGKGDVAVGNVLGSNVFNMLCVLPICQILMPGGESFFTGPWAMHAFAALMVSLVAYHFIVSEKTISRAEGAVLLTVYGGYLLAAVYQ
ncbi:MAG: sodium:calcium antiporter [Pseudomonadota bacterium]